MSLGRELLRGYARHRLYGGGRRRPSVWGSRGGYWGAPGRYGHWMGGSHRGGAFGRPRPRGGVQVRGCGCCLPIPLGALGISAVGLRALARRGAR